jgi:radical SAM superfamily enzyme YgiQ (UPF0313 family)
MFPRLSLPVLASLTPPEIQVEIVDEYFEDVPFDDSANLVGIGFMTPQAPRAYQIGDEFRKRGKKVVMGGIHASALPEEALVHADAVVVGEAEDIWPQVLEDFKNGKMQRIYKSLKFPKLEGLRTPRYDLLKKDRYRLLKINFPLQAGRGCPFDCEFCSVTKFFGHSIRYRSIEDVIGEIKRLGRKKILFIDDNITGNHEYAKDLFTQLKPLKIRWGGQASINLAKNESLLKLAAESGCAILFIGIESLSDENLKEIGKNFFKAADIQDCLQRIQSYGISIRSSIVFGFDQDDRNVFKRTADFLVHNHIAYADFFILTPLPGTGLRKKLENQNRIMSNDWSDYDSLRAVFTPKLMTVEELNEGLWEAYQRFYSVVNILRRVLFAQRLNRSIRKLFSNFFYRSLVLHRKHPIYGG